ncbi:glycosyl hydrolase [Caulobacter rhizosphaerae]|uniref:glycosyl hydrolase n=1 Tax=Caulobacter rhizosphaerae TaxID=2010972 RepID=UPI001E4B73E0|nr:glycosyl hydrolase [Caulobacter rhizosphaerae]
MPSPRLHAKQGRGHDLIGAVGPMTAAVLLSGALAGPAFARHDGASPPPRSVEADRLERDFKDPPAGARPRVWWHWMNGNITKDGIRKDLEWMKRSGIAGVQTFDANIATPQIVDRRLTFMSAEWKDAFRFAASEADRLDLELAIASSPGFSVTGGPWVQPKDGMKKIAWSETTVQGGAPFQGKLPRPPETTGPFQDTAFDDMVSLNPTADTVEKPRLYRDTAVFAYRVPVGERSLQTTARLNGKAIDGSSLSDGAFASGVTAPRGTGGKPTVLDLTLDKPQPVRSVTYFTRGAFRLFRPGIVMSRLEASSDGITWRKVVDLPPSTVPVTLSFAPVEARFFRCVMMTVAETSIIGAQGGAAGFDQRTFDAYKGPSDLEIAEMRLSTEARVDRWEAKAGFADLPAAYAPDPNLNTAEPGVSSQDVIDLTGRMAADGALTWTPPPGRWRIVRMGWSLLGTTNHPASPEGTGLEVDKIDPAAVRRYLETYLALYRDAAGPSLMGKRGVQALLTDSTEAGSFNWTPGLLEHFQRLRGYDPRPWLPTLTGVIVQSRALTDQFLYDYRRTLGDLYATEHYATVARVAHENGLKVYGESLEGSAGVGDDLDMRRYADVPMGAQWTFGRDAKPQPHHEADMRGAASVAHVYGQNIVAAESLTSAEHPWAFAPADLRATMDLIFASGVNRPVIHTSAHVPRDDRAPGLSLWIYGQYFNRMETWAGMARPWIDYIARSSVLLQAGHAVADVAYFYGEDAPIGAMSAAGLPADLPTRHAYDFVSARTVRDDLKVDDGDVVAPSGARYRVLYLGGSSRRMTLPTLRGIAALAEQGATIVGEAPTSSPSLEGSASDYARLVRTLWSGEAVTTVGQGRVIAGPSVEKALDLIGAKPDFQIQKPETAAEVRFVHRRLPDGDLYFVNHRGKQAVNLEARFGVTGKAAEIWRADAASIQPASYRIEGDGTVVPLNLAAEDSLFVVFRHDATGSARTVPPQTAQVIAELGGAWNVTFQPGRGAPAATTLSKLQSLSEQPQPGVRYFSGVSTYRKTIEAPRSYRPGAPVLLDLGTVGDVAEVWINGQRAGVAWQAPYRVNLDGLLRPGRNRLEVRVANLWVNRLIGDAQPGAAPIAYAATPAYTADAPLRPSGLIGPVRLMTTRP